MSDSGESSGKKRNHPISVAAFIAFVGPLIGCALFLFIPILRLVIEAPIQSWSFDSIANAGSFLLIVLLYAYIFAGPSSLISGAVLGWHTFKTGAFGYGRAVVVAIASTVVGSLPIGIIASGQDGTVFGFAIFLVPFAVVSALICRWLMPKIGLLNPPEPITPQITEK